MISTQLKKIYLPPSSGLIDKNIWNHHPVVFICTNILKNKRSISKPKLLQVFYLFFGGGISGIQNPPRCVPQNGALRPSDVVTSFHLVKWILRRMASSWQQRLPRRRCDNGSNHQIGTNVTSFPSNRSNLRKPHWLRLGQKKGWPTGILCTKFGVKWNGLTTLNLGSEFFVEKTLRKGMLQKFWWDEMDQTNFKTPRILRNHHEYFYLKPRGIELLEDSGHPRWNQQMKRWTFQAWERPGPPCYFKSGWGVQPIWKILVKLNCLPG